MLSFATPELLWLLPAAPLVGWWWHRRRRPALRYPSVAPLAGLPRGHGPLARWAGTVGRAAVVLLLVLAAAGPRVPDERTRLPAAGVAVALVFDVSGSMGTADFAWSDGEPPVSRLEAAKRAFRLFVAGGVGPDGTAFDGRPADPIAVIPFAAWPQTECPLTFNRSVLLAVLDAQRPRAGADAGTNVGDAIAEGLLRLSAGGHRRRVMVLLSDGEHNVVRDGPDAPLAPRAAAKLAANLDPPVTVYTIDCGGDPKPDATDDDRRQREGGRQVLRDVAGLTGGRAFAANDGAGLRAACQAIDALERTPAESYQYRRYHPLAGPLAVAATAVLAAVQLLEATRWRRLP
jgi:Ca-activated chloride channel family protein